ncbi:hypothetical protein F0Q53_00755 [Anaplasma marginale]|uniref:Tetratricopeptide repeat protein n=2 Tax=Anaplasma marginale TaxID=770 RepID=B9KI36_ANAMF|nr:hypothetical protein [Anaplasma marginale]ACM49148.1 Conserved hypothetical protein [Anaplasma marginale str. Florida]AXW83898.1 hypothetical protein CQZ76_01410 [Anaplasma marginale]AXW84816.1 hypothetical protein BKM88_01400 [Anaplasma marginale]KAA8473074.1 hypothetical protein F0Q58_00205 [Anaplasma marginale]KAA8475319.1 hypothetical protein F0Q53_00755 [Anaplasma marginale]
MEGEAVRGFFVRFRGLVVVLVLLVLGASGAAFLFENRREEMFERSGDAVYFALKGTGEEGIKSLEEVSRDEGAGAHLAKFRLAHSYVKDKKDVAAARDMYAELAAVKGLARELRELAEYLSVVLSMSLGETGPELESRLMHLASSKDGVYKSSAKEALVVLQLRRKDVNYAVSIMREILGDTASSPEVKSSVESLLRVYGD